MSTKKDCDALYEKIKALRYTDTSSWDEMRDCIKKAREISKAHALVIYDNDFNSCYKMSYKSNSGKRNFDIAKEMMYSDMFNMGMKIKV